MDKTNQQIADKVFSRIEVLILHEFPKPMCVQKQIEHRKRVTEIKKLIAQRLYPGEMGIGITVEVNPF
jgi:hypothetical protein